VIERVTVIKFRMDNRGGNGAGCFEVELWADAAMFKNVIVAGFRKCRDLVGEGKVFIKDKAKVASRVGCSERRVVYFRKSRGPRTEPWGTPQRQVSREERLLLHLTRKQ